MSVCAFVIVIPCRTTSWGSWGWARLTWFWTSTAARSRSRERSKYTCRFIVPSLAFDDLKYSRPSSPESCCSMGAATAEATSSAVAPGYTAETWTDGGVIAGYRLIGKV